MKRGRLSLFDITGIVLGVMMIWCLGIVSVCYGAGRGALSLARPRPYTGPGEYF